ncbi:MAG: hypothetical protein HYS13_06810 [Planctomycetia bacterium]|nr:hypothetical protein [Planctomycetia bacterium]
MSDKPIPVYLVAAPVGGCGVVVLLCVAFCFLSSVVPRWEEHGKQEREQVRQEQTPKRIPAGPADLTFADPDELTNQFLYLRAKIHGSFEEYEKEYQKGYQDTQKIQNGIIREEELEKLNGRKKEQEEKRDSEIEALVSAMRGKRVKWQFKVNQADSKSVSLQPLRWTDVSFHCGDFYSRKDYHPALTVGRHISLEEARKLIEGQSLVIVEGTIADVGTGWRPGPLNPFPHNKQYEYAVIKLDEVTAKVIPPAP